jgi:N-acetyl-gamma-glutamylphosphate reductase
MAAWYLGQRLVLPSWLLDYLLLPDLSRRRLDSEIKQQQQISNPTSTPRALLVLEHPLLPQRMIFVVTFILTSVR